MYNKKSSARLIIIFYITSATLNVGVTAADTTDGALKRLNDSIAAAYEKKDFPAALAAYEKTLPLLRAKYGACSEQVGLAMRNYGMLLASLGKDKEALASYVESGKVLRSAGKTVQIGSALVGQYSVTFPAGYDVTRIEPTEAQYNWHFVYDFRDKGATRQQAQLSIELMNTEAVQDHQYKSLSDFMSRRFAETKWRGLPGCTINGIKFERASYKDKLPGDYGDKPALEEGIYYYSTSDNRSVLIRCASHEQAFPITRSALEPVINTLRRVDGAHAR